jgi:hypothetical protein
MREGGVLTSGEPALFMTVIASPFAILFALIVQAWLSALKTGAMHIKKTVQAKNSHLHDCSTPLIPANLRRIKHQIRVSD